MTAEGSGSEGDSSKHTMTEGRKEGDAPILPVVEEILLVERRLALKEELEVKHVVRPNSIAKLIWTKSTPTTSRRCVRSSVVRKPRWNGWARQASRLPEPNLGRRSLLASRGSADQVATVRKK